MITMADSILTGVQDLTAEALADVHRLHGIVHPARPGGVHEPDRNPGGCDAVFCTMILPEVVPMVEPAIRADEARKVQDLAETLRASIAALNEHIEERAQQIAADRIAELEEDIRKQDEILDWVHSLRAEDSSIAHRLARLGNLTNAFETALRTALPHLPTQYFIDEQTQQWLDEVAEGNRAALPTPAEIAALNSPTMERNAP
ncbi:hypothetical protein [Streptosporangium canum]|uniref:hypothetical protein n=1 Tax=Streptosporangium canum TaxID=324952 RepID=UPI0037A93EAB